ncbi:hypothetical protein ACVWZA_001499 [Sphingomonas sp. UYAg733]
MRAFLTAILLAAAGAAPVTAQNAPQGAWKTDSKRAIIVSAGISIPTQAASLSLVKTGEASQNGSGIDNVAQYASEDGAIEATAFIFYTSYADAALASLGTDNAIRQRFSPALVLGSETLIAAGGVPRAAIRRVYEKGELEPGKPLTTTAAFVRAAGWQIVIRASGPAARRVDIEAALDALVGGLAFDGKSKPMEALPIKIEATCPAAESRPAKRLKKNKDSDADMLIAGLLGGAIKLESKDKPDDPGMISFPRNGASPICVRGTASAGNRTFRILQPVEPDDDGMRLLIQTDDAGGVLAIEPQLLGEGYRVKRYGIGFVDVLGGFQTLPNATQIGAIIDGSDRIGATVLSRSSFTPDGKSNITINSDTFR